MIFEWDEGKARANFAKHGVQFETARRVWKDSEYVLLPDRVVDGEERWHAIGLVTDVMLLVVVHTYLDGDGGQRIRIISARRATRSERRHYER